jgi:hypothetical protein
MLALLPAVSQSPCPPDRPVHPAWLPQLFHRARRAFLRQLLLELGPALDSLGQTYWLDFGCLLGIHRCMPAAAC